MSTGIIRSSKTAGLNVDGEDTKPWYRQFWPWFIIALPATAVVASLYTVWLAASGQDSLVVDDYRRIGKATHVRQERDRAAAALNARANVIIASDDEISVALTLNAPAPESLWLELIHPTLKDRDRTLPLTWTGSAWRGRLAVDPASRWYIQIGPENGDWRLAGSLNAGQTQLQLSPGAGP
jgi:hypothetical protein